MNLVGYTTTALSRNDIIDTPTNKNIVDFSIVELKDYDGNLVTIYDDINGTNPETQKSCDADGQLTFFAEAGDYILEVNGRPQYITISVNITVVNEVSSQRIWGDRYKGELTADVGVTLTDEFSVLLYNGNYYSYTGSDPFPVIVASGTVPDAPNYKLRNATNHEDQSNVNSIGAHNSTSISLQQGGSVQDAISYATPEMFGEAGSVSDDSTQPMLDAITFCKANKTALVLSGDYRVTATLDFSTMVIISHGANIYKDHDGIGVLVQGDAVYTDFSGRLHVRGYGDAFSDASAAAPAGKENDHGVRITGRCRVNGVLFSRNHYGNGFDIETIGNMNKCIFKSLWSLYCSGYGMLFHGTRDDASVWEISTYSQYCWLGGQYIPDDYAGRQWDWFCYNEGTTNPSAPYGVYTGGLITSDIYIYSEEQTAASADAIHVPSSSDYLTIFDARGTRTVNNSPTTIIKRGGSVKYYYGESGQERDSLVCPNLTDNSLKTVKKVFKGSSLETLFEMIINGSGGFDFQAQNRSTETLFASVGAINSSARAKGWKSNSRADFFLDSHRGTPDSWLPVQSGNFFSRFAGRAAVSSSEVEIGYEIKGQVIGTPSSNDITANLVFGVTQGGTTPTTRMTLLNTGELNVPGGVTPFTGLHIARSKTKLEVGYAVVVEEILRETVDLTADIEDEKGDFVEKVVTGSYVSCTQMVKHSDTKESKVCVGIVDSCTKREDGMFDVNIAAVGDNSTTNLTGFKVCNEGGYIEAGDILCTSSMEGVLMKAPEGLPQSVSKFKALESASFEGDEMREVYGYFI